MKQMLKIVLGFLILRGAVCGAAVATPPAQSLPDGRVLQIEGVTWGKEHRIGKSTEMRDRLGTILPSARKVLAPERPASKFR